jgi:hypothetical protein
MYSTPLATVRPGVFLAPLGVWVLLAVLAVANGVFRETVLIPRMDGHDAHVLSTAILVAVILAVAFGFFARSGTAFSDAELVAIGVVWTLLTVGFEFLVGYAEGTPVSTTIGQYDVTAGQVWIAVPIVLLLAPYLFGAVLEV